MGLGTFAPGPYTMTYNAVDTGMVEGVRRITRGMKATLVRADSYGQSAIDGIYQGGDCFCQMTFKEWTAATREAIWPFGSGFTDTLIGEVGQVGRMLTDLASQIVLTAVAGTPAANNGPATLTFPSAIISEEHNSEIILGSAERNVPVVFRCFPTMQSGKLVWFTAT